MTEPGVRRQPFRADIQGLRAIAVGLVVLYHGGLPGLSGGYVGVDIFFVISGFLITNHLLASLDAGGKVGFASFYAKRARRILPASLVVLVVSLLAALIFLAPLQRIGVLEGALATALYIPNIWFAMNGTDYLADATPSVFQHYWSLGVEEQFYLIWPAFLSIGFLLFKGSKRKLLWALSALVIVSFAACILLTYRSQPWAFFSLPTRAWEFGIGGLSALIVASGFPIRIERLGPFVGWLGISGILASAFLFDSGTPFPGIAAALPTVATALIILGGAVPSSWGPGRVLSIRPMVFIGTISYSLYLVHWPLQIIPAQAGGADEPLPLGVSLTLSLAAVPVAWALYRWIELPAMKVRWLAVRRPRTTLLSVGAASVSIAAVCAIAIPIVAITPIHAGREAEEWQPDTNPSFTAFVPSNLDPSLTAAQDDNPSIYSSGCHAAFPITDPVGCTFGKTSAPLSVALFGDSHAAQWFPALKKLADEGSINLRVDTKSSCPSANVPKLLQGIPYTACDSWRGEVIDELNSETPDVVILSNFARSEGLADVSPEAWAGGLEQTIMELDSVGETLVIEDTPMLDSIPPVCLSAHVENTDECAVPTARAIGRELAELEQGVTEAAGGTFVSLNKFICSTRTCGPIVGNVLIYRDDSHLTSTFVEGLSEQLEAALFAAAKGGLVPTRSS